MTDWDRKVSRTAKKQDAPAYQFLYRVISRHPGKYNQSDLHKLLQRKNLHVKASTGTGRLCQGLEEAGLIEVGPSPKGKRGKFYVPCTKVPKVKTKIRIRLEDLLKAELIIEGDQVA